MIFYQLVSSQFIVIKALILSLVIHIFLLYALGVLGFQQKITKPGLTPAPIIELRLIVLSSPKSTSHQQTSIGYTDVRQIRNIQQAVNRLKNTVTSINTESIRTNEKIEKFSDETFLPQSETNNEIGSISKKNMPTLNENYTRVPSLELALRKSDLPKSSLSELASMQLHIERTIGINNFSSKIDNAKKEACLQNQGAGLLGLPIFAYRIISDKCTFN
jgi:hypothetical protein